MSVRIGIIGTGVMGADHARTLGKHVPGAILKAVYDADATRARTVAEETGAGTVAASPAELIADQTIDAVLIASPDGTHQELVLSCLAARKPVLCEKPLAPTPGECLDVIRAEQKLGKRLVQVGYMRRFDPSYVDMKAARRSGQFGQALMFHCFHRNVSAPPWFDAGMAVTNSAVHEFDIARWLLDDELTSVETFVPGTSQVAAGSPVFLVLSTASGLLVTIEVFNNAGYGYDVRGELVCERGTVSLRQPASIEANAALARTIAYPADWRPRFADAYRLQLQAWVQALHAGTWDGANAWDGYAASAVAEAGVRSLAEGRQIRIELAERPALYSFSKSPNMS
jgi:myo-inositol 2-dehydrogenase / D-chiro-inositol 1-dehydrogenase